MSGFSGTSFISAQPQEQPFPDIVGGFLQARDNALAYRTNTFNLDALQQKQAQEQQINALAPRILAGDQAAYEQAVAIDPVRTQAIRSGNQEYDIRGAANRRADVASGLAVNQDQRALESHISTMTDAQRRRAHENLQTMGQLGGALMTLPNTAAREAAWPQVRETIKQSTGNDPGETYPGDARVQQFLTQAQTVGDLFKQQNSTYANPWATPGAATTTLAGPAAVPSPAVNPVVQGGAPIIGTRNPVSPPSMDSGAAPAPQPTGPQNALQPRLPTAQQYAGPLGGIIKSAADKYRVAPEIVAGIVRVESGGNVNAVGPQTPTGRAYGPMQLQIATAQEMNLSPENIHEPAANIDAGTGYFAKMRNKYGGNTPIALAAYNWGPTNVDRWLRTSNGDLSTLPPTVQRYIQNVMGGFAPADANQPWQSGQLPPVAPRGQLQQQTTPADLGLVGSAPANAAYDVSRERMAADAQAFQDPMTVRPLDAPPAPAPLPAALVGTGPLAQAANAAVTEPGPVAPNLLDVPDAPGFRYLRNREGYKPAPGDKDKVLAQDRNGNLITVAYPGSIAVDAAKAAAIEAAKDAAKSKQPTEGQSNAGLYARRMAEAENILNRPEIERVLLVPAEHIGASIPFIGNSLSSSEYQQATQAERNFINATLRRESGAAIASSEYSQAALQYFPRPGDSREVLDQKAQNRRTAIEEIKSAAGPAGTRVPELAPMRDRGAPRPGYYDAQGVYQAPASAAAPAASPLPKEGDVIQSPGRPSMILRNNQWVPMQ